MCLNPQEDFLQVLNRIGCLDKDDLSCDFPLKQSPYCDDSSFIKKLQLGSRCISLLSTNICSVRAKLNELQVYLENLSRNNALPSIICLQEAFCTAACDISSLAITGYKPYLLGRSASGNGGLLTYVHHSVSSELIDVNYDKSLWEGQFLKIPTPSRHKDIILLNAYRPPRTSVRLLNDFYDDFSNVLKELQRRGSEIIALGDFNIDLLKLESRPLYERFFELICSFNLLPLISKPTRISSQSCTLIDNIFHSATANFDNIDSGILTHRFSDHQPIFAILSSSPVKPLSNFIQSRKINDTNMKIFKDSLANRPINVNTNYPHFDNFYNAFKQRFSEHFPLVTKRVNKYTKGKNNWITNDILSSIKKRDKLYFKLRKEHKSSEKYAVLKEQVKNFNKVLRRLMNQAKKKYFHSQFNMFKNDIKKTWRTINDVIGNRQSDSFPGFLSVDGMRVDDMGEIVEHFNVFFAKIGHDISNGIVSSKMDPTAKFHQNHLSNNFEFKSVSEAIVLKAINSLNTKNSFGCDEISTKLIKYVKHEILNSITILFNDCITHSTFPNSMKIARVIPLHKKGRKDLLDNYRPISLLPSISKIFERLLHDQLYEYFETHGIFDDSQYGFRQRRSTELAAAQLVNTIRQNNSKGRKTIGIFLDLSKAFDTINHNILISKLHMYGLSKKSVNLIASYLYSRRQYIDINGTCSSIRPLLTGVPQGSILGPLLFIIYLNDLASSSSIFQTISYADDTTLLYTIPHKQDTLQTNSNINVQLGIIGEWFKDNKLKLNIQKSNFMYFRGKKAKRVDFDIEIDGAKLEQVDTFKFLGLFLNYNLRWDNHIRQISVKISRGIGIINKLRPIFPKKILETLYHSLVMSHINYQILNWGSETESIHKLQKRAIRAVCNARYLAHSSPLFRVVGTLKVDDLYRTALLKLYYNFQNQNLPNYFLTLDIKTNMMLQRTNYNTRRCNDLAIPRAAASTIEFQICNLVNKLPPSLRTNMTNLTLQNLTSNFKRLCLEQYNSICTIINCYSCKTTT